MGGLTGLSGLSGLSGMTGGGQVQEQAMSTAIVDLTDVETRQTRDGYELKCPECGGWYKSLLATEQGQMCPGCWDQARRMLKENERTSP